MIEPVPAFERDQEGLRHHIIRNGNTGTTGCVAPQGPSVTVEVLAKDRGALPRPVDDLAVGTHTRYWHNSRGEFPGQRKLFDSILVVGSISAEIASRWPPDGIT